MYGNGSGISSAQLFAFAKFGPFSIFMVLGFIAFVAAIVVTVLLYRRFVSEGTSSVSGKRDWRPFFRFETLLIDKILKALYIFVASLIAFESAAGMIASLCLIIVNPIGALFGIILIAIVCIVFEVLNRLAFEQTMLLILIWRNSAELRNGLVGGSQDNETASKENINIPSSSGPVFPTESMGWHCDVCGAYNKSGAFCAQCGKRRE